MCLHTSTMCLHTTMYPSAYDCISSVRIPVCMCPHSIMCVRILLYMCPHTTIYLASSYYYICVLIPAEAPTRCCSAHAATTLQQSPSYHCMCPHTICTLLYMCPQTCFEAPTRPRCNNAATGTLLLLYVSTYYIYATTYVSSYYYITYVSSYYYMCPHTGARTLFDSRKACPHTTVYILLYMCPHTTTCVSSYRRRHPL
jgi:hypothetical protein